MKPSILSALLGSTMVLATAGGATGCVDSGEAEDGIDDSFLSNGKADAFGVAESSPEAIAVLGMLRTASLDDLDNAAGLASNAAKAIIHHRQGGDRMDGTADDDTIESLAELDAIPYVGPMTFRLLLDQARTTVPLPSGDPFDATFCGPDTALTMGQVRGATPNGETVRIPTTITGIRARSRTCVTPDNCPAWLPGVQPNMFQLGSSSSLTKLSFPQTDPDGALAVGLAADGRPVLMLGATAQVEGNAAPSYLVVEGTTAAPLADDNGLVTLASMYISLDDALLNMVGDDGGSTSLVGAHCSQFILRRTDHSLGDATHREIVMYARY